MAYPVYYAATDGRRFSTKSERDTYEATLKNRLRSNRSWSDSGERYSVRNGLMVRDGNGSITKFKSADGKYIYFDRNDGTFHSGRGWRKKGGTYVGSRHYAPDAYINNAYNEYTASSTKKSNSNPNPLPTTNTLVGEHHRDIRSNSGTHLPRQSRTPKPATTPETKYTLGTGNIQIGGTTYDLANEASVKGAIAALTNAGYKIDGADKGWTDASKWAFSQYLTDYNNFMKNKVDYDAQIKALQDIINSSATNPTYTIGGPDPSKDDTTYLNMINKLQKDASDRYEVGSREWGRYLTKGLEGTGYLQRFVKDSGINGELKVDKNGNYDRVEVARALRGRFKDSGWRGGKWANAGQAMTNTLGDYITKGGLTIYRQYDINADKKNIIQGAGSEITAANTINDLEAKKAAQGAAYDKFAANAGTPKMTLFESQYEATKPATPATPVAPTPQKTYWDRVLQSKNGSKLNMKNYFYKQGGEIKKFQQGGAANDEDKIIALVTLASMNDLGQPDPQVFSGIMQQMQQDPQGTLQALLQDIQTKNPQALQALQDANMVAQLAQAGKQMIQAMSLQQLAVAAKFGAKLGYIHKLRTGLNPDEEVIYYRCGGGMKKKVVKKGCSGKKLQGGDKIDEAKCGKKMKKCANGSYIEYFQGGGTKKKKQDNYEDETWDGTEGIMNPRLKSAKLQAPEKPATKPVKRPVKKETYEDESWSGDPKKDRNMNPRFWNKTNKGKK